MPLVLHAMQAESVTDVKRQLAFVGPNVLEHLKRLLELETSNMKVTGNDL